MLLETGEQVAKLLCSMTCFYELPEAVGRQSSRPLRGVREDAQLLYGFNTSKHAHAIYAELIKTNVGPKLARWRFSGMSAQQLVNAVEREELAHW